MPELYLELAVGYLSKDLPDLLRVILYVADVSIASSRTPSSAFSGS